jgi:hypothetical protein
MLPPRLARLATKKPTLQVGVGLDCWLAIGVIATTISFNPGWRLAANSSAATRERAIQDAFRNCL